MLTVFLRPQVLGPITDVESIFFLLFPGQEAKEENLVYLLLRAVLLMKAAGYTERATATMQAMLEM